MTPVNGRLMGRLLVASLGMAALRSPVPVHEVAAVERSAATRARTVSLLDYASYKQGDDWAPALMRAIADAGTVHVPAGRYRLRRTVDISRDGVRLYGDGAASELVMVTAGKQILEANRAGQGRLVRDITVERLGFVGTGSPWTFALQSVNGQRIHFRGNTVRQIGVFRSVYIDPAPDRFASDVEVLDNTADGGVVRAGTFGVLLENTKRAQVARNRIRRYYNGIQWWGGEGDPASPAFRSEHLAGELLIEGNHVSETSAGIWGSNGHSIVVRTNEVTHCQDVCLDAESSDEVRFIGNTARYAGTAVLAIFHRSSSITFENNVAEQAGGFPEHAEQPAGRVLFESRQGGEDPGNISVVLRANQLSYSGAAGVGVVRNRAARSVTVVGNRLVNTVIDLKNSRNGSVRVAQNRLVLAPGRGAGRPITVSGSTATGVDVSGNEVATTP